jgi:DNA topoisomerase VI subunit B
MLEGKMTTKENKYTIKEIVDNSLEELREEVIRHLEIEISKSQKRYYKKYGIK